MEYYFSTKTKSSFDEAIDRTKAALKNEGFGVLTEIDVKATLKEKINVDFKPYRILGACSPHHAHKAFTHEDKIGVMLPCNVIVQQLNPDEVEIAAVDPIASMAAIENNELGDIAMEVQGKLKKVIENLRNQG